MITPLFEVKQTDEFVIVVIKAPYIKASAVEFYILEKTFKVYAKPYFLRLVFQQELVEDGREKAQYDIATSELTLFLPKLVRIHKRRFHRISSYLIGSNRISSYLNLLS